MKSILFIFMTVVLGMTVASEPKNGTALIDIYNSPNKKVTRNDARIDFMLGNWLGTGFVTSENGMQQYVEIQENNIRISATEYQMVGIGKNPANGYPHKYNKTLHFNSAMSSWYTKGTINDKILHDSRTLLNDTNVITYSFYDINSVLTRYTIARETDDSFIEMEEKWGPNGWDKTAWFRMKRNYNYRNNTARPVH